MTDERILVVDEGGELRDRVYAGLSREGLACQRVASGEEAVAALRSGGGYSLLLSEMIMEGMDGLTLLAQVSKMQPELPFVMLLNAPYASMGRVAIDHGAYDYLLRPFEHDELLLTVRRALEVRRLKLENLAYQTKLESLVETRSEKFRQSLASLEHSYDITLEALGDALDLKDPETQGHSRRVTASTMVMARAMGLPHDQVRVIARGAFLHDIGKLAIPDAILGKPGPLTAEEQAIMKEHATFGYRMLNRIPFLREAAEIVYCHQERFDGNGYPRGLKGEQIPLGARIFAIADTFDAITSDRPYRAAQSISCGRQEVQRHAGMQFDPEIVEVFLSIPEQIWKQLRDEIEMQSKGRQFGPQRKLPVHTRSKVTSIR